MPYSAEGQGCCRIRGAMPFLHFSGKRKNGEVAEKDKKTLDVLGFFV